MYRIFGLLRVLIIWLIVTTVQLAVFIVANTVAGSKSLTVPIIVIGVATGLFGLIAYFQDKELKRIEKESAQLRKKLDNMFDF